MTLRWGIVTAGKISHDFVNAFNSYPNVGEQIIAAFAKLHKIGKVFDSYQKMAESNDIDITYIGALNPDHYHITKLFLENGKHVLCEKPLCLNHKQVQSLVNISKQKKLFLMEAIWSRFSPVYLALEKEIQAGKLGEIKHVEANFGAPIATVDRLSAVLDIGVYTLQFAQFVFKDEPIKVTAVGNLNEYGVDTTETVILEYEGGRRAVLNVDSTVMLWNKATVVGTKGRMTVEEPLNFPHTLIHVDGTVEKHSLHTSNIPYVCDNTAAGLVYQALEVEICIRKGLLESPRMSHKDSLVLAKLEDAVRKQIGVHYDVDDEEFP
ncbi:hypothetical protein ABMA28_006892 [Loxostege sticticalis]|uniref:Trans-1,2-dihydrobenzene-1,2-diol dehydrogenase n=1 Tax=Loxostege sticticalis TaxID=481309 RepID=A0ABD0TNX2_LOXSC